MNSVEEPIPGGAFPSMVEEKVRAVFVFGTDADAPPVMMGDYAVDAELVLIHEEGGELGGVVDGAREVVPSVLAHFDGDRIVVAGAVEVSVLALFIRREMLVGVAVLDGEVPGEEADAVATGAFRSAQRTTLQSQRVMPGIASVILSGMDGDVAHVHRAVTAPAVGAAGDHVLNEVDFAEKLRWRDFLFHGHRPKSCCPPAALRGRAAATSK